jgi:hypothetical protein
MRLFLALSFLCISLCASSVQGADVAGIWKSSSGSVIVIPANPENFDIIMRTKDGRTLLFSAAWVGKGFKQFTYSYQNVAAVCNVEPNDFNKITVTQGDTVTVWTRERTMTSAPVAK